MNARPLPYAVLASVAFGLTAVADLRPSFAGRVDVDHPVTTAFVPSAALDPWRMMFASGMSERADGTRDLAFSASGAPCLCKDCYRCGDVGAGKRSVV